MDLPLPRLTDIPTRHADCCLSISNKLINVLSEVITRVPRDGTSDVATTVLSIGSGTGLLEAILLAALGHMAHSQGAAAPVSIEGVEVYQAGTAPVNRYLPEQAINTVRGTWHVSPRVGDDDVCTVFFVYPRLPALVSEYAELISAGTSSRCDTIVWLGPRADWADFEPCFRADGPGAGKFGVARILEGGDAGLVEYEIMVVLKVQR
jgi:hypothetical protein